MENCLQEFWALRLFSLDLLGGLANGGVRNENKDHGNLLKLNGLGTLVELLFALAQMFTQQCLLLLNEPGQLVDSDLVVENALHREKTKSHGLEFVFLAVVGVLLVFQLQVF